MNPHPHKASIERDNESEDMQPSGRGYDHGITTFSPDGRLFQVEYARESVKRGTTTAGLKFREGVVLVCDKRIVSRLIIPESIEKMFKIDNHIGIATSGLVADARQLVARARVDAQVNRITYAASVPVDVLVKKLCDFKQSFTQYGGSRPFGTALLIGGVDANGIHLYETDPSGAYQSYHAGAIGSGRNTVIEYFESNWKEGLTLNAAMKLGLEALRSANDTELNREAVEVTVVDGDGYRVLDRSEVNKQIDRLKPLEE
ncbi:MAG: archaeal proteasome endopeptidase complex subunit alpha [Candidatus Poseidoniaceae archaeon]|nr:archaeal proteasome endopeptidase complex subunit alpha [Candidatus Poseidoniaceae archaeon]